MCKATPLLQVQTNEKLGEQVGNSRLLKNTGYQKYIHKNTESLSNLKLS